MNKKKICIIIITALIFIILVAMIFLFTNKDTSISTEEKDLLQKENTTYENEISNVIDENTTNQNEVVENTISNAQEKVDISNVKENNSNEVIQSTQKDTQNNKSSSTTVAQKESTIQTQVETNKKTEEPKKEEPKEETTQVVPETNVEKYVRNDAMINKIIQIIQNNESENMKNFGYNIVVDSAIKTQTNQFTFTESRVINAIKNKFGTIRIYVEDYYKNGQLIMTECYIL